MTKKQKTQKAVETVETVATEQIVVTEVITANEVDVVEEVIDALGEQPTFDAFNKEFLETSKPEDYFSPEVCSSKYDGEREQRVQIGLSMLTGLTPEFKVNPLLLLLGKWWEVKPARAAIKKMIDVEATEKGYNADAYLQIELNKEIERLAAIQTAIDRLRYAKTYFKPRAGVSTAVPTKDLIIDGEVWEVPINELEKAKAEYADRDDLKRYIKTVSKQKQISEIEEI